MKQLKLLSLLVVLGMTAYGQQPTKTGLIITTKYHLASLPGKDLYLKSWSLDSMMRYYVVDSANAISPRQFGDTQTHNQDGMSVSIHDGPASVQIMNVNTGAWYTLIKDVSYQNKVQNIAVIEKPKTVPVDSSKFFTIKYQKEFKTILSYRCQKVIIANKRTQKRDSVYVTPQLNRYNKYPSPFQKKYGIKDFIVETYEYNGFGLGVNTLVDIQAGPLPQDLFQIPEAYKKVTHDEFYKKKHR